MRKLHKMSVKLVTMMLLNAVWAESAVLHGRPKSSKTACLCGDPPHSEVRFFHIPPENVYNESKDCHQLCSEDCSSDFCLSFPNDVWNADVDVINHVQGANLSYQDKVSFPTLDGDGGRESLPIPRGRRSTHKCTPPPVEHAAMHCSLSGEFTLCDIRCSLGYAFVEDGKMLTRTNRLCKLSHAVWTPKGTFPVCRPRMNCKAVLVRPGKLTCYPGDPETPYCDISCKPDYENGLGEVVVGRYECVDERFGDGLPHCATLDETAEVIRLSENRQTDNATQTAKE